MRAAAGAFVTDHLNRDGIRIALDDFGTGYSSLTYLRRLPIDCLKIDRSFVNDLAEAGGSQLVRGILALAHSLGLRVVAEGVETRAQLQFLTEHACEEAQGFLLAKPMPAARLEHWLASWLHFSSNRTLNAAAWPTATCENGSCPTNTWQHRGDSTT